MERIRGTPTLGNEKESGYKDVDSDGCIAEDRISSLPDSLIDCILNCLTNDLATVVRTSVLSKRWKSCWTRVSRLVFYIDGSKEKLSRFPESLISIVDSVISRHDGPVDEFSLWGPALLLINTYYDVSHWIERLTEKKIGQVSFYGSQIIILSRPGCIFSCPTLKRLSLQFCHFGPCPDFGALTNLVCLSLDCAVKITSHFIETLISNSPRLIELKLGILILYGRDRCFVINAPGLQTLSLNLSVLTECCLREYPNLTSAHLDMKFKVPMVGGQRTSKLENFVQLMPKVESLKLTRRALSALAVGDIPLPMKLPTPLENLVCLEFSQFVIISTDLLSCLFCLIRSSPNLQSLKIDVSNDWGFLLDRQDDAVRLYEQQAKEGILSHLSSISFASLLGYDYEVKFISIFISCCPMLKNVMFSFHSNIERDSEERLVESVGTLKHLESTTFHFQSQN